MARPALAVGGIVLILAGAAVAFGWFADSETEVTAQVDTKVERVRLDSDSGSVTIRSGDVQATTVVQRFDYRWGRPEQGFQVNGSELVLADCGNWCRVDYEVTVPRGVAVSGDADSGDINVDGVASVDVTADSGSIDIRNISGAVKAQASSGDIQLDGVSQEVNVTANSGDITGTGIRGKVDAKADSGSIKLTMAEPREVRAQADSGSVDLTVPAGSYRVDGDTDSGDRRIDLPVGTGTPTVLWLGTDSGDVTVRAA